MFYKLITAKRDEWYRQSSCPAGALAAEIRKKGRLRDPQIESIKTYLFLKLAGQNKSLAQLFKEGFFCSLDLDQEALPRPLYNFYSSDPAARSFYEYAKALETGSAKKVKKADASLLQKMLSSHSFEYDFNDVIDKMFYEVSYADYIFSLPMGAGKTFLMAVFIYLDLYYAQLNPQDPRFAHNFLVFAPSGLKSSIMPSLKTIADFDPAWIFDDNTAAQLKSLIKFEILDEQAGARKSNRVRNPNAQKIALHQPFSEMMGLVAVTNAEKVILDGLNDENADSAGNELRDLIGCIPHLSILIDEVHHAAAAKKESSDVKLRQVVESWALRRYQPDSHAARNQSGSVTAVLGFSGTPYVDRAEKIDFGIGTALSSSFINNVVYYYPLSKAVKSFLKKPKVFIPQDPQLAVASREYIIEKGLQSFLEHYKDKRYDDNTCPKIAVYCAFVEELETEIYPRVCEIVSKAGLDPHTAVLKYHGGGKNNAFALPKANAAAFANLDSPLSQVRVILLAQIGKEGWDCRSLTGVILSAANVCKTNMVLQTCCRCLRQVGGSTDNDAQIWLNRDNAEILNKQLQKDHDMTLAEFKALGEHERRADTVPVHDRRQALHLGRLVYFNMELTKPVFNQRARDVNAELLKIQKDAFANRFITTVRTGISNLNHTLRLTAEQDLVAAENALITFSGWLHLICRESGSMSLLDELLQHQVDLSSIFYSITEPYDQDRGIYQLSPKYDQAALRAAVRRCFYPERTADVKTVYQRIDTEFAKVDQDPGYPLPLSSDMYLYPEDSRAVEAVLKADAGVAPGLSVEELRSLIAQESDPDKLKILFNQYDELIKTPPPELLPEQIRNHTLHYIPYCLNGSLERTYFADDILNVVTAAGLDVFYNGDNRRGNLFIKCYVKRDGRWRRTNSYRPDFLIAKRSADGSTVEQILMVETKGSGFEADFALKRGFMQEFIRFNQAQHNPIAFDFLYLPESLTAAERTALTAEKMEQFFSIKLKNET